MNTQMELISPKQTIRIEVDGCKYEIQYNDSRTGIHPPKWFVLCMQTYAYSKRFYSRPGGAANALFSGSIVWEK